MHPAIVLLATHFAEVNPNGGGLYLDLLNIQWWQAIIGIIGVLGLSPAPWLTAMATGRLLFRGDLAERLRERDAAHEKALAERDRTHAAISAAQDARYADLAQANARNVEAAQQERDRADKATANLAAAAEALEANSHIMASFRDTVIEAATR